MFSWIDHLSGNRASTDNVLIAFIVIDIESRNDAGYSSFRGIFVALGGLPRFGIFCKDIIGVEYIQDQAVLSVKKSKPEEILETECEDRPEDEVQPCRPNG